MIWYFFFFELNAHRTWIKLTTNTDSHEVNNLVKATQQMLDMIPLNFLWKNGDDEKFGTKQCNWRATQRTACLWMLRTSMHTQSNVCEYTKSILPKARLVYIASQSSALQSSKYQNKINNNRWGRFVAALKKHPYSPPPLGIWSFHIISLHAIPNQQLQDKTY